MMRHKNFAVFILTHGRPDKQKTLRVLRKRNYTGKVYLVVDNEDITAEEYKAKYDDVIIFDKEEAARMTDRADTVQNKKVIVFARNICFKLANDLDLKSFLELDDDYTEFQHRYDNGEKLAVKRPDNLDDIFDAYLDFLDVSGAKSVCMAQCGDFIGGRKEFERIRLKRKAMNAFFCRTDRSFRFLGRINEDVNTYTTLAHRGYLFFTLGDVNINQTETQQSAGGMTDVYKEGGTYIKSFYTVMMCPSAVKISSIGAYYQRIHHKINWERCAPKILRQEWRK